MAQLVTSIVKDAQVEAARVPPQSVEAEQSVLGGLLLDNTAWDRVADVLGEQDFYRADHRLIFGHVGALIESGKPADALTVAESLERSGKLAEAGGQAYLGALAANTPSAANIRRYAEIVRERAVMRNLAAVGTEIADSAYNPLGRDAKALVDEAEAKVFSIAEAGAKGRQGFVKIDPLLTETVERIDLLYSREDKSEIIGLATGFVDLDRMTSGLQGGDLIIIAGRPSMGKCIVAGSRLLDLDTGRLEPIEDRVRQKKGDVVSVDACGRLRPAEASAFVDDGIKPVYRVRTALGREITTTLTHPFLTLHGWRPLGELRAGNRIAVPRVLPHFGKRALPDPLVRLAAYFLTDGGLTHTTPKFTNGNARIRRDFIRATESFPGMRCRIETSGGTRTPTVCVVRDFGVIRRARLAFAARLRKLLEAQRLTLRALAQDLGVAAATVYCWTTGAAVPRPAMVQALGARLGATSGLTDSPDLLHKNGSNPVTEWLREIGLWGKSAHEKRAPDLVFELPQEQLALFLNRAFACDGSIYVQNGDQAGVSYSTVHLDLARDIQHLLLRFGILAKLRRREVLYQGGRRPAYELRLTRQEDIQRFVREIGVFGKERSAERALKLSLGKHPKVNLDVVPAEVWALIERKKGARTWAEIGQALGLREGLNLHVGTRGISRERLWRIAEVLDDDELRNLARSDLYWDRIERIEYAGQRRVYDLTVPEHHNFVAEDMVVHNTALAANIAEHVALEMKKPVAIFSMEMSGPQLAMRMIGSVGRVDQHELRTGTFKEDDWSRLVDAVGKLNEAQIFIDDTAGLNALEVRARARRLHRQCGGLSLIVVDYLQLMSASGREENRATEIAEISRSLKGLAKDLKVPVIALSQLNRGVEARQDKRPMMSDLRECVTGDALVMLADGRRVPIRGLVGTTPEVLAMSAEGRIEKAFSDCVWSKGVKPVIKVNLASGRTIRATAEHRLFGPNGWITVGELTPGARLALSRRLPDPQTGRRWKDDELILLGHLVGDGSYLTHQPMRYTTASEANSEAVTRAAESFGSSVKRYAGRGQWHQLLISGNGNRWHAEGVGKWLKDLGIYGQRSHEKRLPSEVFQLCDEQIGLLLRHLWATDGSITVRKAGQKGSHSAYFATSSHGLALDVAALLMRLGIVARIRKSVKGAYRPMYSVDVSGAEHQCAFLQKVGAFGPRVAPAAALRAALEASRPNTNVDTLPVEAFADVRASMRARGVTTRAMTALRGTAYGGASHFSFAPSRAMVDDYADKLGDESLRRWSRSDLFWDRVVSVEPDGEEEVFDLTVPGPSCWLADGIVSHNSGALEQDADLILFIYRDEVYNPDTPNKGIAEIILAKQRNGPIGKVNLTFLGKYTRFESYAGSDRF